MTATMNSESVNNLFELIENGLNQQVLELVADKPSLINSVSEQGLSLIETAIKNGFTGLVIELLSFETLDVNHSGHNPLRIAVATGNLSVAAALLDKGASPNYRSEGMSSSLLLCLESEYFALAKKMIKHGAEVDIRNEHGWTPLIWASIKGRLKAVEFLLNHGANIHACNNDGWNALTGAYFKKQTAVVNLLLEKGAVFSEKYAEAAVLSGYQSGFLDVVEYLLNEMDVNPNIADDKNESLLAKAVTKGDWAMVKLLLNKKANPNVFDENGFPLIALLARDGHNELIEDRKSTRLNSSHVRISYAVFCLKKKKNKILGSPGIVGIRQLDKGEKWVEIRQIHRHPVCAIVGHYGAQPGKHQDYKQD